MTLSSQAPRLGRVYTKRSSHRSRRRGPKGPWGWKVPALVLLAVGLLVYVMFFRGGSEPTQPQNPVAQAGQQPNAGPQFAGNSQQAGPVIMPTVQSSRTPGPGQNTAGTLTLGARYVPQSSSASQDTRPSQSNSSSQTRSASAGSARTTSTPRNQVAKTKRAAASGSSLSAGARIKPAPQSASRVGRATAPQVVAKMQQGQELLNQGKHIDGRNLLSQLLTGAGQSLSAFDSDQIRKVLTAVNSQLVFSPHILAGDPLVEAYKVQRGDSYTKIAKRFGVEAKLLDRSTRFRLEVCRPVGSSKSSKARSMRWWINRITGWISFFPVRMAHGSTSRVLQSVWVRITPRPRAHGWSRV